MAAMRSGARSPRCVGLGFPGRDLGADFFAAVSRADFVVAGMLNLPVEVDVSPPLQYAARKSSAYEAQDDRFGDLQK